jgi:hypothetical protein
MEKMKYVLNHPWKFDCVGQAYMAGFMQCFVIIVVTLLNYFTIIAAETVIDIVMNFLALAVIAELDDFFFTSHGQKELGKRMVINDEDEFGDLYKIETTTSIDAGQYFINNEEGKPDETKAHYNLFKMRKDALLYIKYQLLERIERINAYYKRNSTYLEAKAKKAKEEQVPESREDKNDDNF